MKTRYLILAGLVACVQPAHADQQDLARSLYAYMRGGHNHCVAHEFLMPDNSNVFEDCGITPEETLEAINILGNPTSKTTKWTQKNCQPSGRGGYTCSYGGASMSWGN